MSERARLALEPGVGEVVVAGRVEFDGHVRRGEELHDRMTFYMAEDRDKKWNIKRKTDCLLNNFLLNLLFL